MKVLVTGVNGQLGYDVVDALQMDGFDIIGTDISDYSSCKCQYCKMDLMDLSAIEQVIDTYNPDVIIHCAGWTAVDAAEDEANRKAVFRVNSESVLRIAEICRITDCKLVYISTDYVFDGEGDKPFSADDSRFGPLNVYGESKLLGEKNVRNTLANYYIVRISWAFGKNGNNFVKAMLKYGKNNKNIRVVNDQIGLPTYTYDLARLIVKMIKTDKYGTYNVTNSGDFISWYEFALEIFRLSHFSVNVIPVSTEEYGLSKAIRPKNSRLELKKLLDNGFELLPDWKDALSRYLKEIKDDFC